MPLNSPKRPPYWNSIYFWFRFRPYYRSRHVVLHQSAKFYPNRTTSSEKNDIMSIFKMVDPDFMGPIMGSLKSPHTTSYRSSIYTIALLSFLRKSRFCILATDRQTDRQTNKRTDGQPCCMRLSLRDSARVILLRLTIDGHKASRDLSATAGLIVAERYYVTFGLWHMCRLTPSVVCQTLSVCRL